MDKPDKIWAEGGSYPDFRDDDWVHASASTNDDCGTPYLLSTPERELASELVEALRECAKGIYALEEMVPITNKHHMAIKAERDARAVLAKLEGKG